MTEAMRTVEFLRHDGDSSIIINLDNISTLGRDGNKSQYWLSMSSGYQYPISEEEYEFVKEQMLLKNPVEVGAVLEVDKVPSISSRNAVIRVLLRLLAAKG